MLLTRPTNALYRAALALAVVVCGGCGGGGGGGSSAPGAPALPASGWVAGSFLPASTFAGRCVSPRAGMDPATGLAYIDRQGAPVDQNHWLRSWSNDLYLWYNEIVDRDPGLYATPQYFDLLKTDAQTASGRAKDRFHFTYSTTDWLNLVQSGVEAGYGVSWAVVASLPPRRVVVAYTEPGSPADAQGVALQRGEEVLSVDGVDVVNSNTQMAVDAFVAGLYPDSIGESHTFRLRNPRTSAVRTVRIDSAVITKTPVLLSSVLPTPSGNVGYLVFNDHLPIAEQPLMAAIQQMQAASVSDLVLDLRYNGGGALVLASELAYMIAGPASTAGQTFERLQFNDKHMSINPVTGTSLVPMPFFSTSSAGQPLPTLNLSRVYVLTGGTTCSASESIINGLRGVGVQVVQIGSTTCGKPYGFYPKDNCGTTYFTVQFKGVNAAGFGEYTDGFSPSNTAGVAGTLVPGCSVADDFSVDLGNPNEKRLDAALDHRLGLSCPVPSGSKPSFTKPLFTKPADGELGDDADVIVHKSPWLTNRWLEGA